MPACQKTLNKGNIQTNEKKLILSVNNRNIANPIYHALCECFKWKFSCME